MFLACYVLRAPCITHLETSMTQQPSDKQQNPGQPPSPPPHELNKEKQRAEEREIAGRHKSDGQKDHKGAR